MYNQLALGGVWRSMRWARGRFEERPKWPNKYTMGLVLKWYKFWTQKVCTVIWLSWWMNVVFVPSVFILLRLQTFRHVVYISVRKLETTGVSFSTSSKSHSKMTRLSCLLLYHTEKVQFHHLVLLLLIACILLAPQFVYYSCHIGYIFKFSFAVSCVHVHQGSGSVSKPTVLWL